MLKGQSKVEAYSILYKSHPLPVKTLDYRSQTTEKKIKNSFPEVKRIKIRSLTSKLKRREMLCPSLDRRSVFIKAGWTSFARSFAWAIGVKALTRVSRAPRTFDNKSIYSFINWKWLHHKYDLKENIKRRWHVPHTPTVPRLCVS